MPQVNLVSLMVAAELQWSGLALFYLPLGWRKEAQKWIWRGGTAFRWCHTRQKYKYVPPVLWNVLGLRREWPLNWRGILRMQSSEWNLNSFSNKAECLHGCALKIMKKKRLSPEPSLIWEAGITFLASDCGFCLLVFDGFLELAISS